MTVLNRRIFVISAMLMLCLLLANAQRVSAAGQDIDQFDYSALEDLAIQDLGFSKTLLSFATQRVNLITGKGRFEGKHPIGTVLGIMCEPVYWRDVRLFKIEHPDLVALFQLKAKGVKRITVNEYGDPAFDRQLRQYSKSGAAVGEAVRKLNQRVWTFMNLSDDLAIVPLRESEWIAPGSAGFPSDPQAQQIKATFNSMRSAFISSNVGEFARQAQSLRDLNRGLAEQYGEGALRLKIDRLNTRLEPFKWSFVIYLFSALLYLGVLVFHRKDLAIPAAGLLIAGLLLHCLGLVFRTIIVGRAPVSNLYESFTFAIAGVVLVAIIVDWVYKNRLGGFAGALLGFIFLVMAHKMPVFSGSSQVKPLMPALQSSWLTYHVITIMLSYSAFALSFLVSCFFVAGYFNKSKIKETTLSFLEFFNYRIIAIGFPLLTIGIITGAVWAATAWGRPWGFDPKETWSAITWIIYGIMLHVRYLPQGKGIWSATISIIGFVAVIFTYLGVNLLLPGLHSYAG